MQTKIYPNIKTRSEEKTSSKNEIDRDQKLKIQKKRAAKHISKKTKYKDKIRRSRSKIQDPRKNRYTKNNIQK